MRFLADENLPRSILRFLREKGFNVKDIQEESLRGIEDQAIWHLAQKERRIILIYDKDFLIPKDKTKTFQAIVLHFPKMPPKKAIPRLVILIQKIVSGKIKPPFIVLLGEKHIEIIR